MLNIIRNIATVFFIIIGSITVVNIEKYFNQNLIPVLIDTEREVEEIKSKLLYLKAPSKKVNELSIAIKNVSGMTGISSDLLIALIYTESTFNKSAVSSAGYKGLMQTPMATMKWADVDILMGAKILKEKLVIADNNLADALMLYKGGRNPVARAQADNTMKLYKKLSTVEI